MTERTRLERRRSGS